MNVIRSRQHEIFTETVNKVALSAQDDKRIILPDRINIHAWGHLSKKIGPKGNNMGVIVSYCMPKGNRTKGNKYRDQILFPFDP